MDGVAIAGVLNLRERTAVGIDNVILRGLTMVGQCHGEACGLTNFT